MDGSTDAGTPDATRTGDPLTPNSCARRAAVLLRQAETTTFDHGKHLVCVATAWRELGATLATLPAMADTPPEQEDEP